MIFALEIAGIMLVMYRIGVLVGSERILRQWTESVHEETVRMNEQDTVPSVHYSREDGNG